MNPIDRMMAALFTGFVATGTVTLALAVLGLARPPLVLTLASVVWALLWWAWGPTPIVADGTTGPNRARQPHPALLILGAAVIMVSTAHNVRHHGDYVVTDRDSGIYVVGGKWIADHGTLWVDSDVGGDLLAVDGVVVTGGGQTATEVDGRLQIQGAHLFHSLLAVGEWVGGAAGAGAMPAFIGGAALAALFWLALKVVPDWVAVMVVTALAVDFAWLYTVRASLSEPLLLLISASGAGLLIDAVDAWPDRPWRMVVAGFVAATALTARVDAGAVLLAFPLLVSWAVRRQGPGSRPLAALCWWGAGAILPLLLAVADLTLRSPRYLHDLRSEVVRVVAAMTAAVTVAVVVALSGTNSGRLPVELLRARIRPLVPRLAAGAAVAVVALAAFAWFVRPELGPDRGHRGGQGWRIMEAIQINEGLEPDGRRTYAERVVDRIRWYTGPMAIAAGVAGLAILAWRLVSDRIMVAHLIVAGLVTPYLLMYLYLPSVDADHPWFIRRYVPTAIPGVLLFAGIAATSLVAWKRVPRSFRAAGAALIVVGCVAWPLAVSLPLRAVSWQAGGRDGVERLCHDLAPGSVAVLAADNHVGLTLLPAIRSYCEVEAVAVAPTLVGEDGARVVEGVIDAVERRQRGVVEVLALTTEVLEVLAPDATDVREVVILDTTQVSSTIGQVPSYIGGRRMTVWVGTVRPA